MLRYYLPLLIYLISFPVMIMTFKRVHVGLLFFIFIVPIIVLMKKLVVFPMGNNIADFLVFSMLLGWFLKAKRENKKIFERSSVNIAVILTILGSILSLIVGLTFTAFPSDINSLRLAAWKNYMILPLLYFISINTIDNEKTVKWILISVCLALIAMDINFYSTFRLLKGEHYSDAMRTSGPFGFLGPNELGIFFSMYTFLLLGISYFIDNKKLKYFLLFVCACNIYPILYSYSRSAYMCVLAGLLTIGLLKDRKLLILPIVLVLLYSYVLPNSVVERIDMTFLDKREISEQQEYGSAFNVGDVTVEVIGRKQLWEKARNYFEENFLLGIGFETFHYLENSITHSMYYNILAEQGLVGMTIFLVFIAIVLPKAYKLFRYSENKLGKGIGLGFLACVIVHLVGSVAGETYLYYNMMAIYWLFLGIVASFNIHFISNKNQEVLPQGKTLSSSAMK